MTKINPYWAKRQARFMYGQMDDAEKTAAELTRLYQKAAAELQKSMDQVFTRYQSSWGLTQEDARELLNRLHGKTDLEALRQAASQMKPGPARDAMLREIEAPAYAARIRRMQALQDQVDVQLRQLYKTDAAIERRHYLATARESYYHGIYDVQRQVGFQFSFAKVDPKAVQSMVASRWDGRGWSKRLWGNTLGLTHSVKDQLMLEMLTGRKLEDAAQAIAERYGTGAFNARRLVRTESNFVAGQGQLAAYTECGIDEYVYVATLDTVTCPSCGALDGKRFKVKDAVPGVNMNPMHPFCRCTTVDAIDDDILNALQRRARDPVTGENKLVPASTTYEQWARDNGITAAPKAAPPVVPAAAPAVTPQPKAAVPEPTFKPIQVGGYTASEDLQRRVSDILSGKSTDRVGLGEAVLRDYGVTGVPVRLDTRDAWGSCGPGPIDHGTRMRIYEYNLKANDTRPVEYQVRTAFHEAYHAMNDGRPTDFYAPSSDRWWRRVEEPLAEASAHFMASRYGITGLAPSYGDHLVNALPRLKKLPEFEHCKTLVDFGEVAFKKRYDEGYGSVWRGLYDRMMSVDFKYGPYVEQYFEVVNKKLDQYVDAFIDNAPTFQGHADLVKRNVRRSMSEVRMTGELSDPSRSYLHDIIAVAMNDPEVGVL